MGSATRVQQLQPYTINTTLTSIQISSDAQQRKRDRRARTAKDLIRFRISFCRVMQLIPNNEMTILIVLCATRALPSCVQMTLMKMQRA
jgi:hypothetical protein